MQMSFLKHMHKNGDLEIERLHAFRVTDTPCDLFCRMLQYCCKFSALPMWCVQAAFLETLASSKVLSVQQLVEYQVRLFHPCQVITLLQDTAQQNFGGSLMHSD